MAQVPSPMFTNDPNPAKGVSPRCPSRRPQRRGPRLAGRLGLVLLLLVAAGCRRDPQSPRLFVYCGAGLRPPLEEIVTAFQQATGIRVEVNYGASNLLLGQIRLQPEGDVFIPGEESYTQEAHADGLAEPARPIALFVPVILVAAGNPLDIQAVDDLARSDQPRPRLALADLRTAAIGPITQQIIALSDLDPALFAANVAFEGVTVHDLTLAVTLGHADAAIVWRPVAMAAGPATEIIPIAPERNVVSRVTAAVLTNAAQRRHAQSFVEFLSTPQARQIFRRHHYDLPD